MGIELEWKFSATEKAFSAVKEAYTGAFSSIRMETTYYDTTNRFFSARRCTLRARLENGRCICTLKTPAEKGRTEWELERDSIQVAAPELCKLAGLTAPEKFLPVCGAKFTRLAATIQLEGAAVELALDRGVLTGGGKELPLLEVEVEYKSGSEAVAEGFAVALAKAHGLTAEHKSKFKRAIELAEDSKKASP